MNYESMTLKEKVFQTFIVTIREINKHGGPKEFFKKYPVGGMYYSQSQDPDMENKVEIGTASCLKRLGECKENSKLPLLVCADGVPLSGQTIRPNSSSLGGTRNEKYAYEYGKIIGMSMNENGIDWVLGPIIDMMYYNCSLPFPAMSNSPEMTAKLYRQVVKGIQDQGVCATVKHFPGLGTDSINMHFAPGRNVLPFSEWMDSYGYTYMQMFEENVCSVMTTHTTLRSFDNETHDGFYPIATYSEKLTKELLKDKLGFKGAVVTDALIMGGMATGDLVKETVQAFKAGADLLLWPPVEAADEIVRHLESGEIPMSRLDDALMRIQKMRQFRENAKNKPIDVPNGEFANKITAEIINDGICLRKNEINLLPLSDKYKNLLIIDATDNGKSTELLKEEFTKYGLSVKTDRIIYDVPSRVCWQDDIDKIKDNYDLVIFNIDTDIACTWSEPFMLIWASHLFDKSKKLIINFGSPYFASDYFPEDPTLIDVNSNATAVSVKAVVEKILGKSEFKGYSNIL